MFYFGNTKNKNNQIPKIEHPEFIETKMLLQIRILLEILYYKHTLTFLSVFNLFEGIISFVSKPPYVPRAFQWEF